MNGLLSELRKRIAALKRESPSTDRPGETSQQTNDRSDAALSSAEDFNERARQFLQQRQDMHASRDTTRPQR